MTLYMSTLYITYNLMTLYSKKSTAIFYKESQVWRGTGVRSVSCDWILLSILVEHNLHVVGHIIVQRTRFYDSYQSIWNTKCSCSTDAVTTTDSVQNKNRHWSVRYAINKQLSARNLRNWGYNFRVTVL